MPALSRLRASRFAASRAPIPVALGALSASLAAGSLPAQCAPPSEWGPFRQVSSQGFEGLLSFGGRFHGTTASSVDGLIWHPRPEPIFLLSEANGMLWGYAQPDPLTRGVHVRSEDGVHWDRVPGATNRPSSRVVYGADAYVFTSVDAVRFSSTPYANWSTNGTAWQRVVLPAGLLDGGFPHLAFGNGRFLAINSNLGTTAVSTNGQTWTAGPGAPDGVSRLEFQNGAFHLVLHGATVRRSLDGAQWTGVNPILQPTLYPTQQAGGEFFTYTPQGQLLTSTDGTSWTARVTKPTAEAVAGIAFQSHAVVLATLSATFLHSLDPAPPRLAITSLRLAGTGTQRLDIFGPAHTPLTLERSSNLLIWEAIQTASASSGLVSFDEPIATGASAGQRFYRASIPAPAGSHD